MNMTNTKPMPEMKNNTQKKAVPITQEERVAFTLRATQITEWV